MCKYRIVKTMKENGTLKAAVNSGIVPLKVARDFDVYEYFLTVQKRMNHKPTTITIVSEDKKVCESLVYRIVKEFGC